MSGRRRAGRLVGALVALLLLLSGCASSSVAGPEAGPATARATTTAAPVPPASRPSRTAPALLPRVPTTRATLPATDDEPAPPAAFRAERLQVDLPVVAVGVDADGALELPRTVQQVAWYEYGSRPGDPAGTTVLAGHVDTRAEGLGPFARLRELHRGDELVVADARGRPSRYTVTSVDEVQKSEVALDQLFRRDGAPELRVLTCGGPFSRRTGYRDLLVVSARPS